MPCKLFSYEIFFPDGSVVYGSMWKTQNYSAVTLTPKVIDLTEEETRLSIKIEADQRKTDYYNQLLKKVQKQEQTLDSKLPEVRYLLEIDEKKLVSTYNISNNKLKYEYYGKNYKSVVAWIEYVIPEGFLIYEQATDQKGCYTNSCIAINPLSIELLENNLHILSGTTSKKLQINYDEVKLTLQQTKVGYFNLTWLVNGNDYGYWLIDKFSRTLLESHITSKRLPSSDSKNNIITISFDYDFDFLSMIDNIGINPLIFAALVVFPLLIFTAS